MKIRPDEIRCVEVKGPKATHVYLYRARSEESDSLKKVNGILHARGLLCEFGGEWTPGWFRFRKASARLMQLVTHDWAFQWFAAGIMLGERFDPYGGRRADFDHAENVWRYWMHWQLGEMESLLTNDCAGHLKTTPDAVRVQLSRLGLSRKPHN
jgi:hypothetical protein